MLSADLGPQGVFSENNGFSASLLNLGSRARPLQKRLDRPYGVEIECS